MIFSFCYEKKSCFADELTVRVCDVVVNGFCILVWVVEVSMERHNGVPIWSAEAPVDMRRHCITHSVNPLPTSSDLVYDSCLV